MSPRLIRDCRLPVLLAVLGAGSAVAAPEGWFPFAVSPLDNPSASPIDLSFLNGGPASRRVTAKGAHFVDDSGERVRFLGVNVTFAACFPEKENATRMAKRLAQLGFNVVRFHHMDARDIWLPGQQALDPEKLERLDWFIHQLKENGIYANLNLHVSRTYPGLKEANLPYGYRYGKMVDRFYEPFIRLQEEYATALLDRVNPHTGLRVADDPCLAFVEMNNENTLLAMRGEAITGLSEPYRGALEAKWRQWLRRRYADVAAMTKAWNADAEPPGAELLKNAGFEKGLEGWSAQGPKKDVCALTVGEGPGRQRAAIFDVRVAPAVSYGNQLHQIGIALAEGRTYTLRFQGRADPPREISAYLSFANAPWTAVAERHRVKLDRDWREHVVVFKARGLDPSHPVRLSLGLGESTGQVAVASFSLRPGRPALQMPGDIGAIGLAEAHWPPAAAADFREAMADIEQETVGRIARHIRERLRLKAMLCDTQASYGGCWGLRRELATSDYVDMHAYWQHPRFPGRPWDSNNWNIPNTSMVADPNGGTLGRLALYRGAGKPYSVSEYNHPAPNDHAAEMFPMLGAFAAAQDWDAIYQFSYLNSKQAGNGKINGYFELAHHPAQLAFAPIAAVMLRAGGVRPLPADASMAFPLEGMRRRLESDWITAEKWLAEGQSGPAAVLSRRCASTIVDRGDRPQMTPEISPAPAGGALIDTPAFYWKPAGDSSEFLIREPSVRTAIGNLGGRRIQLNDVIMDFRLPAKTWACASIAALDGRPIAESGLMLLVLATRAENSGMVWNADRTSVGRNWGDAPVMVQFVPAKIHLPGDGQISVHPLDAKGEIAGWVAVNRETDGWTFDTGTGSRTLWFAVKRAVQKK